MDGPSPGLDAKQLQQGSQRDGGGNAEIPVCYVTAAFFCAFVFCFFLETFLCPLSTCLTPYFCNSLTLPVRVHVEGSYFGQVLVEMRGFHNPYDVFGSVGVHRPDGCILRTEHQTSSMEAKNL